MVAGLEAGLEAVLFRLLPEDTSREAGRRSVCPVAVVDLRLLLSLEARVDFSVEGPVGRGLDLTVPDDSGALRVSTLPDDLRVVPDSVRVAGWRPVLFSVCTAGLLPVVVCVDLSEVLTVPDAPVVLRPLVFTAWGAGRACRSG